MTSLRQSHILHSTVEGVAAIPGRAEPFCGACRYLISLDYDGTLRRGSEPPEAAFFALAQELRPYGVRWGVNTGRSLRKLEAELESFPHLPDFICTCERYVYIAGDDGTWRESTAHNSRCHAANTALRERLLPEWKELLLTLRAEQPLLPWEPAVDDPLSIEAESSEAMEKLMPRLKTFAQQHEGVSIQRAGRFMRLSDARYSKGSALHYIQQLWSVPEQHLFLMGDGHNDLDAFRHFPHAWCAAPDSAHEDVLRWLREHGGHTAPGVADAVRCWMRQIAE